MKLSNTKINQELSRLRIQTHRCSSKSQGENLEENYLLFKRYQRNTDRRQDDTIHHRLQQKLHEKVELIKEEKQLQENIDQNTTFLLEPIRQKPLQRQFSGLQTPQKQIYLQLFNIDQNFIQECYMKMNDYQVCQQKSNLKMLKLQREIKNLSPRVTSEAKRRFFKKAKKLQKLQHEYQIQKPQQQNEQRQSNELSDIQYIQQQIHEHELNPTNAKHYLEQIKESLIKKQPVKIRSHKPLSVEQQEQVCTSKLRNNKHIKQPHQIQKQSISRLSRNSNEQNPLYQQLTLDNRDTYEKTLKFYQSIKNNNRNLKKQFKGIRKFSKAFEIFSNKL